MFTYGFYNSMNGDRKYDAEQISSIFDGIIMDGVYSNVDELFAVVPGTGMQVIVKTGRAWFKHTWNHNDSWLPMNVENADLLRPRIDSVIIEVNSNVDVRANSIKIIKGTVATSPVAPTMIHEDGVDQYRLADITVRAGATSILNTDIEIQVGKGDTPFVTAPLKTADITDLYQQWNGQFTAWFDNIKLQLTDNVVTNLQRQIDERLKIVDFNNAKATADDVKAGTPDKWVDAALAQSDLTGLVAGLKIGDIVYSLRDLEAETNGKMIACDQRIIKKGDYPELFTCDAIKYRYSEPSDGNVPNAPSFNESDRNGTYRMFPSRVVDGYIYTYDVSNGQLKRAALTSGATSLTFKDVFTVPSSYGYRGTWCINNGYGAYIPGDKKWLRVDLSTGAYIEHTETGADSIISGDTVAYNLDSDIFTLMSFNGYSETYNSAIAIFSKNFESVTYNKTSACASIGSANYIVPNYAGSGDVTNQISTTQDGKIYFLTYYRSGTSYSQVKVHIQNTKNTLNFSSITLSGVSGTLNSPHAYVGANRCILISPAASNTGTTYIGLFNRSNGSVIRSKKYPSAWYFTTEYFQFNDFYGVTYDDGILLRVYSSVPNDSSSSTGTLPIISYIIGIPFDVEKPITIYDGRPSLSVGNGVNNIIRTVNNDFVICGLSSAINGMNGYSYTLYNPFTSTYDMERGAIYNLLHGHGTLPMFDVKKKQLIQISLPPGFFTYVTANNGYVRDIIFPDDNHMALITSSYNQYSQQTGYNVYYIDMHRVNLYIPNAYIKAKD